MILALGLAVFLPFKRIAVRSALAAPLPGVPVDAVTWVKTTETSNFNTPDDPTNDSSVDVTQRSNTFFGKVDNLFDQTYFENGFRTVGRTGVAGVGFDF